MGFDIEQVIKKLTVPEKTRLLSGTMNFANDQETDRYAMSSNMTERTLREVYLLPFQIALREAGPRALMTAYNKLNGLHASENPHLLQDILRKEWWHGRLVMPDW
jgi:beta-glucosidase